MAGHFTGSSPGHYPAPKPPPEAHGAHAHLRESAAPLPNGLAHLVRHDRAPPLQLQACCYPLYALWASSAESVSAQEEGPRNVLSRLVFWHTPSARNVCFLMDVREARCS